MSATADDLVAADEAVAMLDALLMVVAEVRAEKPRDPLRRLEDVLLERRLLLMAWEL